MYLVGKNYIGGLPALKPGIHTSFSGVHTFFSAKGANSSYMKKKNDKFTQDFS